MESKELILQTMVATRPNRWSAMLAVAAQSALAGTLLGRLPAAVASRDGATPELSAVLADAGEVPVFSRLPAR